jgi:hypothetical protein
MDKRAQRLPEAHDDYQFDLFPTQWCRHEDYTILKMQLGVPLSLNKSKRAIIVLHHFIS